MNDRMNQETSSFTAQPQALAGPDKCWRLRLGGKRVIHHDPTVEPFFHVKS